MIATTTNVARARLCPTRSRFSWRGVFPVSTVSIIRAIFPNSVETPVAMTTPRPRPYVAAVPAYAMFFRSPTGKSGSSSALVCFSTATDSPVRAASSIFRLTASMSRKSAGTLSPAESSTTSPGTSSRAGISFSTPSRRTLAVGAAMSRSASMARSARYS